MSNKIDTSNTDYQAMFNQMQSRSDAAVASIFGNLNTSSASSDFSLADYASIKNGSYYKLTKAYYAKQDSKTTESTSEESKAAATKNTQIRTDATALKSAADLLGSKDLNDRDSLYTTAKQFVEEYNAVLSSATDSDDKSILRNTLHMTTLTKKNEGLLSKAGITIGEDNKLSLDEKTFKAATSSSLTSLFKGTGSYMDGVGSYASRINQSAVRVAQKNNTYTASGSFTTADATASTGSIMDNYL